MRNGTSVSARRVTPPPAEPSLANMARGLTVCRFDAKLVSIASRRRAAWNKDFRSRVPPAAGAVPPGQPGYDPVGALAAAYEVAPDFGELCAEVVRRLALQQSRENFAAVAEVVAACIMDSRNMNRLKVGHSVPRDQRATMAKMVAAFRPEVDADQFVDGVLDQLAKTLRAVRDATG